MLTRRFFPHRLSSPAEEQTQQKRQLVASCGISSPLLHPVLISLVPDSTAAPPTVLPSEFTWERQYSANFSSMSCYYNTLQATDAMPLRF